MEVMEGDNGPSAIGLTFEQEEAGAETARRQGVLAMCRECSSQHRGSLDGLRLAHPVIPAASSCH